MSGDPKAGQASARPWRVSREVIGEGIGFRQHRIKIMGADGREMRLGYVSELVTATANVLGIPEPHVEWGDTAAPSPNAEHIVRCVNAHDELLAALKVAMEEFEPHGLVGEKTNSPKHQWVLMARAAIAKAEGETL